MKLKEIEGNLTAVEKMRVAWLPQRRETLQGGRWHRKRQADLAQKLLPARLGRKGP